MHARRNSKRAKRAAGSASSAANAASSSKRKASAPAAKGSRKQGKLSDNFSFMDRVLPEKEVERELQMPGGLFSNENRFGNIWLVCA